MVIADLLKQRYCAISLNLMVTVQRREHGTTPQDDRDFI